jgi:hypothetical protein
LLSLESGIRACWLIFSAVGVHVDIQVYIYVHVYIHILDTLGREEIVVRRHLQSSLSFVHQKVIYADVHIAFLLNGRLGSSATPTRQIYEVFNYRVFRKLKVILHWEIEFISCLVIFNLRKVLLLLFGGKIFKLLGALLVASCYDSNFKFVRGS